MVYNIEEVIQFIIEKTKVDVYEKTRRRRTVEVRSLVFYILRRKFGMKDYEIAKLFAENGLNINRSSVFVAVSKAEMYMNYEPYLKEVFESLYPPKKTELKDELYKLVKSIPVKRRKEVEEKIHLIIDSWSWKTGVAEENERTLIY
jgi:hypothetical protein